MKRILLAIGLLFNLTQSDAQQVKRCGSHEYLKNLDKQYPGFEQHVKNLPTTLENMPFKKTRGQVFIPVVVHIVYKNTTENLSDQYVNAQIDQLNRDFARLNSDTTSLRTVFKPICGPANIRFVLKQIKRRQTTKPDFPLEFDWTGYNFADDVKQTAYGGDDAVTPTTTLNIWVCDISVAGGGDILGYAYPPAGLPNWSSGMSFPSAALDGVVIDYIAFGGSGKLPIASSTYGCRGRTAVHEVGHYLGLRHIWGDDDGACQGQSGFEDDGISDTPHAGDASMTDCNKTKNTCNQGSNDMPDMVENYMDYSVESCQNSFTKGQVSFMENVLATVRSTIHMPTGVNDLDPNLGIQLFPNPATDQLLLNLTALEETEASVTLIDVTGKVLRRELVKNLNEPVQVNIANLTSGTYFVRIVSGDHQYNETFIKQ